MTIDVARVLRASGAAERIVHELEDFRVGFGVHTASLFREGGFFDGFTVFFPAGGGDVTDMLEKFFEAEAATRCVVSDSELAFVNLSTAEFAQYQTNLQAIRDGLDFPFVFLRSYTAATEPSPCDGFRSDVRLFLTTLSVLVGSLSALLTEFSFHVLSRTDVMWDADNLSLLQKTLDRIRSETTTLASLFIKIRQDLP